MVTSFGNPRYPRAQAEDQCDLRVNPGALPFLRSHVSESFFIDVVVPVSALDMNGSPEQSNECITKE